MKVATQYYQTTTTTFGRFQKITIASDVNSMTIIPDFGGNLLRFSVLHEGTEHNVIDGYTTPEALEELKYSKSAFLLPFPNRLKDGKFHFNGQEYAFPLNDEETGNALHGFKDFYNMTVVDTNTTTESGTVTLRHSYDGSYSGFPFPFDFLVTYTLEYNRLSCKITVKNTGNTPMPIGLGWHPYFQMPSACIDDVCLQVPAAQQIIVNERMIPTGETTAFREFETLKPIHQKAFDTGFKVTGNEENFCIQLQDSTTKLRMEYWQNAEAFPFFQLFIPPKRNSIAIEPMSCNIDAFNNEDGLMVLEPKEFFSGEFGFSVTSC